LLQIVAAYYFLSFSSTNDDYLRKTLRSKFDFSKPFRDQYSNRYNNKKKNYNNMKMTNDVQWLCSRITLPLAPDDNHEKENHIEEPWDEPSPPSLPSSFEGVAKLWKSLQPIILQGLRHGVKEEDEGGGDGDGWIKDLLERVLTPHVLEYSIKGMPHTSILKSMAAKLARRIRHLSSNTTTHSIPEGPLKMFHTCCTEKNCRKFYNRFPMRYHFI